MANELDELEKFLNISGDNSNKNLTENGISNGSNVVRMHWNHLYLPHLELPIASRRQLTHTSTFANVS